MTFQGLLACYQSTCDTCCL